MAFVTKHFDSDILKSNWICWCKKYVLSNTTVPCISEWCYKEFCCCSNEVTQRMFLWKNKIISKLQCITTMPYSTALAIWLYKMSSNSEILRHLRLWLQYEKSIVHKFLLTVSFDIQIHQSRGLAKWLLSPIQNVNQSLSTVLSTQF